MRKVLSIVLALLMVSMMIPSMAFADGTLVTGKPTAALVATESFTLTATEAVTVKVNASVFDLGANATVIAETNIETLVLDAPCEFTVTVEDAIPAEQFTSTIRVEAGEVKENIEITIKDRLIGDVNGKDGITTYDAAQILAYAAGATSSIADTFKTEVANVNGKDDITTYDAAQTLAYAAGATSSISADTALLINTYLGGNDTTVDVDDPNYDATTEPDPEPAKKLDAVDGLMAAAKEEKDADGNVTSTTIYYDFDAVENAIGYEVYINNVKIAELDANTTDGSYVVDESVTLAKDGNDKIAVIAKGDTTNYTDSDKAETNFAVTPTSTALAQWLKDNDLEDVVITVYEITAE